MKKPIILSLLFLGSCIRILPHNQPTKSKNFPTEQANFWSTPRKGANFFNQNESRDRFKAAANLSLQWVRLTPSKWPSSVSGAKPGSFLLGNRAHYAGLIPADVLFLRTILNDALAANIKIVITFLDLPGHYWSQHNQGTQDRRLWQDKRHWPDAIQFLTDIAKEFRGHPALVGYDLINEPSPEKATPHIFEDWLTSSYSEWNKKIKESSQDLNKFYGDAIKAIRSIDPIIPIIIETGYYATPWAINALDPLDDINVLYSFHMYEPFAYTFSHLKKGPAYMYPGYIPFGEIPQKQKKQYWDKSALRNFLEPIRAWQKKYHIANSRIVVGEFGVNRFAPGAEQYFSDLINIFDEYNWHWAFYSFREDAWHLMDYELGNNKPSFKYWQAIKKKQIPEYPQTENLFIKAIKASFAKK